MRRTRFLVSAAVILLASLTAASAQTNGADQKGRDFGRDLERAATQDGFQSQQELRQRADERVGREERDPVTTGSVLRPAPTTSGRGERKAEVERAAGRTIE